MRPFLLRKDSNRRNKQRPWRPFLNSGRTAGKNGVNCEEYELRNLVQKRKPRPVKHVAIRKDMASTRSELKVTVRIS